MAPGVSPAVDGSPGLLTEERRRCIVALLHRDGKVLASELSVQLDVSEDTIRRDLRELAATGLLQRVHGGALLRSPTHPSYTVRESESPAAKEAISVAAVRLIQPGQVVILDAGTTTMQIAQHLPVDLSATIVTNSPPAAVLLAAHRHIDVILTGGRLHKPSLATIGPETIEAFQAFHADLCFLGAAGIHPEEGVSILVHEETFVKRAMATGAGRVVAVVAGEKLRTVAPYVVGPVSMLTDILTERDVPDDQLVPYRDQGINVVLA